MSNDDRDEARHDPGPEPLWGESWYFDFALPDGSLGGWVRLGLYPNLQTCWYHAFVCGPGRPTVAVSDQEVPLPPSTLELRGHALWAEHLGSHPFERWQVGNEVYGVAVDDPVELYRPGGARGNVVPMGLELEWETAGDVYHYAFTTRYEIPCRVHGELLLGDERIEVDAVGQRDHSWGVRDWWQFGWVWTAGHLDDGTRFHASDIRLPSGPVGFGYLQPPGDAPLVDALGATHAEEVLGAEGLPTEASMRIAGVDLRIEPLAFAPALLVGPEGQVSRFPRALCRFTAPDGRSGHGWTEWNQPAPEPNLR